MGEVIADHTFVGRTNLILLVLILALCVFHCGNFRVTVKDLRNRNGKKEHHQQEGSHLVTFVQRMFTRALHQRQISDKN